MDFVWIISTILLSLIFTGIVDYKVFYMGQDNVTCRISLIDRDGNITGVSGDCGDPYSTIEVPEPNLWWPYLMDADPGYLYTFQVELLTPQGSLIDKYQQPIGIRTIRWSNTSMFINNQPIYLQGFGRHEDSDIRGKGLDLPLIIRDYNLIKWIGANTYRTSHYPYAEEIMDLADQMGIMIIDECPSVNTEFYIDSLRAKHKRTLTELMKRDKNRPGVIMWSVANEPRTQTTSATSYFKDVVAHVKTYDRTRPVTIVESAAATKTGSSDFVDVVSFNRYNGWYSNAGNVDVISYRVINEVTTWYERFKKPVLIAEYGADTLEGLHQSPGSVWSEEYQMDVMSQHFKAFDELRGKGFFLGEFIWNFADFRTGQSYTRLGGINRKGIFTRNRQPKSSAHLLRKRYWTLAQRLYNSTPPTDLYPYIALAEEESFPRDEL